MMQDTAILIIILIIVFLIFFIIVLLCLRLVLYKLQAHDNFDRTTVTRTYTSGKPLTKEQGEALFDLRDYREKIRSPLLASRAREEDTGLLNALQNDHYYQLLKWAKRLREAQNYGDGETVAAQVVSEMEDRARIIPLSQADKQRFYDLAHLPDEVLVPFDSRQGEMRTEETTTQKRLFTDNLGTGGGWLFSDCYFLVPRKHETCTTKESQNKDRRTHEFDGLMSGEEDEVQAALLILGPVLVISIILLLVYWIRGDKKKLEKERQKDVDFDSNQHVNIKSWGEQHADFYQFCLWIKQLKSAQSDPAILQQTATQLVYELEERSDRIVGLTFADRNRILTLIEQSSDLNLYSFEDIKSLQK
ncbi:hypothetical protein M3Y97_00616900 [Aphelenchoides bicaudatus]|nr:hypothetical protein M3Y97_00616900 [Aphelenchoides bicaudatus]